MGLFPNLAEPGFFSGVLLVVIGELFFVVWLIK